MKLNQFKLIHNGYNISWCDTEEEALAGISNILASMSSGIRYSLLSDTKIPCNDSVDNCKSVRVIIYQYYTHYMEVFVIKHV